MFDGERERECVCGCPGPFNVRNEVDAHPDIIGGHFNNTKFLTGDGGFLQACVCVCVLVRILSPCLCLHV